MEQKEFDALIEKIEKGIGEKMDSKLKEAFKELDPEVLKSVVTNSKQLEENIAKMKELEESNSKLKGILETQGEELSKLKEQRTEKSVSLSDAIRKGLSDNADQLKKMKDGENKESVRFTTKVAGDMLLSTNVTGQIPQAEREAGITRVVRRRPFMLDLVNTGTIQSNLWEWVQQANPDGDAAMTAEGAAKAQIDFDLVLASAQVRKVTAYIKVSKEMLDDIPLMEAEINQELREVIELKIDAQILSGDGTGQNLTGILPNATAWAAGTHANTVKAATYADVIRVAIDQVMVAQFNPNYVILHPSDLTKIELSKDANNNYVLPPFRSATGLEISGVTVVANTGMTAGTFLVGDFTKSAVRFKEGLTFDMGYENDDFTKNMVTILAEARLVHRVKSNHYPAFVTGSFASATTILDPDVVDA